MNRQSRLRPDRADGQSVYAGLDYGHVYGPGTVFLTGTQLAGAVIGVRGRSADRFSTYVWDVFVSTPG